ncbi:Ubiquitin carboxyl-terminal hydrolase 2 [Frankliniella fusca]|uniref:Ubiquitin carboxyl-terminal hydrolase 2 n=1 Tax=Frankliniella fusca TaxID=407009 RepID=A0AAE1I129_9NEOP|nr:Ubiquitin carboxyl-terminal hydrolase 2 [Frankliniella fusca]
MKACTEICTHFCVFTGDDSAIMYFNSEYMYSQMGGPRGLFNLGQSCYINAIVQSLMGTKFKEFCLSTAGFVNQWQLFGKFLEAVSSLNDEGDPFNLVKFVATVESISQFRRKVQTDAQEFLSFFLDTVHNELTIVVQQVNDPLEDIDKHGLGEVVKSHWETRQTTSPIAEFFQLQIVTLMQCPSCNYSSGQFNDVNHLLSVALPSPSEGPSNPTITDCIAEFCKQQTLDDGECSCCKSIGLQHRLLLDRLPPILVVHLKRFYRHFDGTMRKLHTSVSICPELDLAPFTLYDGQCTSYRVVGVTNHRGQVLHLGHYTTISLRGERWYNFDDTKVSNSTLRKLSSEQAYLVWYQRVDSGGNLSLETREIIEQFSQPKPSPGTGDGDTHRTDEPVGDDLQTDKRQQDKEDIFLDSDGSLELITPSESSMALSQKAPSPFQTEWEAPELSKPNPPPISNCINTIQNQDVPMSSKRDCHITSTAPHTQNVTPIPILNDITGSQSQPTQTQGPGCDHPNLDLDIIDPLLNEDDVPGAKLDVHNIGRYLKTDLERWLQCRRLPLKGKRQALITRVKNHMRNKVSSLLYPGVDGGKWYELKRKRLMSEAQQIISRLPQVQPWGPSLFKPFPSVHIPNKYSSWKAKQYLNQIPETRFSYEGGVEAVESEPDSQGLVDFSVSTQSDRKNIFVDGTLRRANNFIDSGRVGTIKDCQRNDHYFVNAMVHASFKNITYEVTAAISKKSGSVCAAGCNCKARALGRCCHVMAVLLLIGRHVENQGHEAVTCTGRLCYWLGSGSAANRQPGIVREKGEYYNEARYYRGGHFDPRPTANQVGEDEAKVKYFYSLIEDYPEKILWYYHLLHNHNPPPANFYPDEQLTPVIAELCSYLLWNLNNIRQVSMTQPLHFPLTQKQSASSSWFHERSVRIPASSAKQILGLSTEKGRMNFMRKHVWGLDPFTNDAMKRGTELEPVARRFYASDLKKVNPDQVVVESGIWVNPMCPQLSCSPDGLIVDLNGICKLLEIKCPAVLEEMDPNNYESLPKDQLGRFCLKRSKVTGKPQLKETNKWYYQVQMSMDIMKVETCDFVVFSMVEGKPKYLTVEVTYDESFWREKRERLKSIHREWFVPEYFLCNTPFQRAAYQLIYSPFHEDHEDKHFGDAVKGVECLTVQNESEFLLSLEEEEQEENEDSDCDVKLNDFFEILYIDDDAD